MLKCLVFLLLLCCLAHGIKPSLRKPKVPYRKFLKAIADANDSLPHTVEIHHYNLTLDPTFAFKGYKFPEEKRNTFTGKVDIHLSVLNQTNRIELNSAVDIVSTRLTDGAIELTITNQEYVRKDHLIISSKETLEIGKNFTLSFEFNGKIIDGGSSVCKVEYVDDYGEETALIATLFEEINARTMFPCFDDPFLKSTFQVTVYHPKGSRALNNADAVSSKDIGPQTITVFGETVKMSTYLLAVAVGNFTEAATKTNKGVWSRVYSVHEDPEPIRSTAENAARIVEIMEELTGIEYPLNKLAHLDATDLAAGAMENYGLIIYNGYVTSPYDEDLVTEFNRIFVIGHETSHQWFGNLVTGKRWGLEYLHESFADFFQKEIFLHTETFKYAAKEALYTGFAVAVKYAESATHAIEDNVSHFDGVTYSVGGALLSSIKQLVSTDVFYKVLNYYLEDNRFGNADTDTLAAAFDKVLNGTQHIGFDFTKEYLYPYIRQVGIPTVTVILNEQGQYVIEQIPFRGSTTWLVPLFIYNLDKLEEIRVDIREDPVILNTTDTLLFNSELKTFAIVELEGKIIQNVEEHKNLAKLSPHNQYIVLKDYGNPESVLEQILKGNDYRISPEIADFLDILQDKETMIKIVDKFGDLDQIAQRVAGRYLLPQAVELQVPKAVNLTQTWFDQFKRSCAPEKELKQCIKLAPELRYGAYSQGAKSAEGQKFLEDYKQRLEKHNKNGLFKPEIDRVTEILDDDTFQKIL